MLCPFCGVDDQQKVISTHRNVPDYIVRRRECLRCGRRFSSIEVSAITERALQAIRRESNHNGATRQFESVLMSMYTKVFHYAKYLNDRRREKRCRDAG